MFILNNIAYEIIKIQNIQKSSHNKKDNGNESIVIIAIRNLYFALIKYDNVNNL